MKSESWTLWMDESGDGKSRPLVVAGLVANEEADELFAGFRTDVASELPWIPWPLHAAELHRPGMHLIWAMKSEGLFLEAFPEGGAAIERAKSELNSPAGKKLIHALKGQGALSGRAPAGWHDNARRLEFMLSRPLLAVWGAIQREVGARLDARVVALGRALTEQRFACAAFAAHGEAAFETDAMFRMRVGTQTPDGRYGPWTRAASELVARVVEVLERQEASVQLTPRPLELAGPDVSNIGALLPVHLCGAAAVGQGARPVTLHSDAGGRVEVRPASSSSFNRDTGSQHVLADMVANAAFHSLFHNGGQPVSMDALEEEVRQRFQLEIRLQAGPPALAAAGDLSRLLRAERFEQPQGAVMPQTLWALEQASALRASGLRKWRVS